MSVCGPTTPPRPSIILLLMSMVNEKQPFGLRCSVLYCFQSYLYRNTAGQSTVIASLLPTAEPEPDTISAGQLVCGGLFAGDAVSNWLSCAALSHAMMDSEALKRDMCRVQGGAVYNPPITNNITKYTHLLADFSNSFLNQTRRAGSRSACSPSASTSCSTRPSRSPGWACCSCNWEY